MLEKNKNKDETTTRRAFLEMPQEGPGPRLPLHSREWPVTHSLATANKNCL